MKLSWQNERLAIARLSPESTIPRWALEAPGFLTISRTADELSIVCLESAVPDGVQVERGRRALKIEGPLDFSLTGILSSLLEPLARDKISVFAISTFDTDYILIKEGDVEATATALTIAGHEIT